LILPPYIWYFELVFTKKNFDILLDHCKWNYAIELVFRAKPKLFKIYLLLSIEQSELDAFLAENLYTSRICSFKFSIAILVLFIKKEQFSLASTKLLDTQYYDIL